jgi:hypothetical protein
MGNLKSQTDVLLLVGQQSRNSSLFPDGMNGVSNVQGDGNNGTVLFASDLRERLEIA